MKSKELECQIIVGFQRTEISMVNLAGYLISMSSAQRTMTYAIQWTGSTSTVPWTTTWHSTTQPWRTQNSLDRTRPRSRWPEKKCRPWAFRTDRNTARQCGLLRASSRLHCTPHHLSLTETFPTDGRTSTKFNILNNTQTQFRSWGKMRRTGRIWHALLADGMKADIALNPLDPIIRSQQDLEERAKTVRTNCWLP